VTEFVKGLKNEKTNSIYGSMENESYIKSNFQRNYQCDTISEYSIMFVEELISRVGDDTIEIWVHGDKYLHLFTNEPILLTGNQIVHFVSSIEKNFQYFNQEIRLKLKINTQCDISLTENLVFSCALNEFGPGFYFWIKGIKYEITEKEMHVMILKIKNYFDDIWSIESGFENITLSQTVLDKNFESLKLNNEGYLIYDNETESFKRVGDTLFYKGKAYTGGYIEIFKIGKLRAPGR